MLSRLIALSLILPLAAPAAAQSLHETHEILWAPAGKVPVLTYRMKDRKPSCAVAHHGPAGKGHHTVRPVPADCATVEAEAARGERAKKG